MWDKTQFHGVFKSLAESMKMIDPKPEIWNPLLICLWNTARVVQLMACFGELKIQSRISWSNARLIIEWIGCIDCQWERRLYWWQSLCNSFIRLVPFILLIFRQYHCWTKCCSLCINLINQHLFLVHSILYLQY